MARYMYQSFRVGNRTWTVRVEFDDVGPSEYMLHYGYLETKDDDDMSWLYMKSNVNKVDEEHLNQMEMDDTLRKSIVIWAETCRNIKLEQFLRDFIPTRYEIILKPMVGRA